MERLSPPDFLIAFTQTGGSSPPPGPLLALLCVPFLRVSFLSFFLANPLRAIRSIVSAGMNGCRFLTSRPVIGWELPQCRCCCFWPIKLAPFGRGLSRLLVDVTSFWRADFLWRISRDARRHHKRHLQSLLSRDRRRVSGCAAHPIISPNEGSTFWGVNVPRINGDLRHNQCTAIFQIACPAATPISKFSSSRKEGREAVRKPVAGREDWGCCGGSIRSIAQPCHSYGGDVNASIG